jgi:hypothetical protein
LRQRVEVPLAAIVKREDESGHIVKGSIDNPFRNVAGLDNRRGSALRERDGTRPIAGASISRQRFRKSPAVREIAGGP